MEEFPKSEGNNYSDTKKWFQGVQEELAKERAKTQADYDNEEMETTQKNNNREIGKKAIEIPWTAEEFRKELEEDREKSQDELLRDHLERQRYVQENRDRKDAMTSEPPAPYREQKFRNGIATTTIRVAPGYEDAFGDLAAPDDWQEPTVVEDDSGKSKLEDSNNLWLLKERKAALEKRRRELESELSAIEGEMKKL